MRSFTQFVDTYSMWPLGLVTTDLGYAIVASVIHTLQNQRFRAACIIRIYAK